VGEDTQAGGGESEDSGGTNESGQEEDPSNREKTNQV